MAADLCDPDTRPGTRGRDTQPCGGHVKCGETGPRAPEHRCGIILGLLQGCWTLFGIGAERLLLAISYFLYRIICNQYSDLKIGMLVFVEFPQRSSLIILAFPACSPPPCPGGRTLTRTRRPRLARPHTTSPTWRPGRHASHVRQCLTILYLIFYVYRRNVGSQRSKDPTVAF